MPNSLETLEKAPRTLITVGVRSALLPANDAVVAATHSSGSVTRVLELEPAPEPPRGSALPVVPPDFHTSYDRRIDSEVLLYGHRQQFWIAARRWTIRAIQAGLISVDCSKASHTSVHAA
jgi:hypothetical protein